MIGYVLMATAILVLVPVALQLRSGEQRPLDFAGYFLFAAGLLAVGAGEAWLGGRAAIIATFGGLAAVLLGLLVARPGRYPRGHG